ncbi:MAG: T9SS type A sorting domain-containing protein [candidate division Zixibacteria bacterium]|nr:T9SS type A sorting domain-containing protein [candidate division Zixibacteria bacterium]
MQWIICLMLTILLSNMALAEDSFIFQAESVMQAVPVDSGGFFHADLVNTGDQEDIYTVTLTSFIPEGWLTLFCTDSLCLFDSTDLTLTPDEHESIKPEIFPQTIPGNGAVIMRVVSHNDPDNTEEIEFRIVSGYETLLINHGAEENQYRGYYEDILFDAGFGHNFWDVNFSTYLTEDLINFENLIIYSGDQEGEVLDTSEIDILTGFLENGGKILFTGQNLASSLQNDNLLEDILKLQFQDVYSGILTVEGEDDDLIGDNLNFAIEDGEGADNQDAPESIELLFGSLPVFHYEGEKTCGARIQIDGYKAVFYSFGLESVETGELRLDILSRTLDWFNEETSVDDPVDSDLIPEEYVILSNYPNPFNSGTTIKIASESFAPVGGSIEIFNLFGQKIKELTVAKNQATVSWDGLNTQDEPVSSGIYLYRWISNDSKSKLQKMLLLK